MSGQLAGSGTSGPVLFFDGECGLCNRIVRLLLKLDRRGVLRFAPLQGATGQEYLRRHGLPLTDFDSLIFVPEWAARDRPEFLQRTDGAIAALRVIGGRRSALLASIRFLPASWRDALYKIVARSRYRVFGKWQPCPLPRPEWNERVFD
ncbi:MAG: DCC1-like thiol-disulfide oxidoreductase family protein [Opitutaceae bacterium]